MGDYALEWYKYGLEKGDDTIVKFMMHWIAFNWLYSCYKGEGGGERKAIGLFCEKHYRVLARYKAFQTKEINIFLESPIVDMAKGTITSANERVFNKLVYGNGVERIQALMLSMYQVRCNLFHGSKSLKVKKDLNLIHASSILLEGYLKVFLSEND